MSEPMTSGLRPHRATLILILGILGLVLCMPLGIAAWVMGNADLAAMNRGEVDPTGRGMTEAGRVVGIVSVALFAIGALIAIAVIGFGGCVAFMQNH
jgi:hypothetical protein